MIVSPRQADQDGSADDRDLVSLFAELVDTCVVACLLDRRPDEPAARRKAAADPGG